MSFPHCSFLRIDFSFHDHSLKMFDTNGPNAIAHEDANCHCSCCKQLPKPAKIIILPSALFRQRANLMNKTDIAGTATANYRGNVISISAAIKSAEQARAVKAGQAKFNYPMLECT